MREITWIVLDKNNGNKICKAAEIMNGTSFWNLETFIDKGRAGGAPPEYKKICIHMVYDVKHNGCHKVQLVAGGHLMDPNMERVYSGVISLRGIRLVVFLAELNALKLWGADVGNVYLKAKTKEKFYIFVGKEPGKLKGDTWLIADKKEIVSAHINKHKFKLKGIKNIIYHWRCNYFL